MSVLLALAGCGRLAFDASNSASGDVDAGDADAIATSDGAIGDGAMGTADAAMIAGNWTAFSPAAGTTLDLYATKAFAANNVWIAGSTGFIQRFDGSVWQAPASSAPGDIYWLWGLSANDLWAVGSSCSVQRWNGTAFTPESPPGCSNQAYFAVEGIAANDVWVSGVSSMIKHYDGSGWVSRDIAGNIDVWSIAAASANEVYFVGAKGTIMRWNGATFVDESIPLNILLSAVWTSGSEHFAVGGGGAIYRKVGTTGAWTAMQSPTQTFLYSVFGSSASDVWAIGENGVAAHYNGSQWQLVTMPTSVALRAITRVPGGGMRMVGNAGTVLSHP